MLQDKYLQKLKKKLKKTKGKESKSLLAGEDKNISKVINRLYNYN